MLVRAIDRLSGGVGRLAAWAILLLIATVLYEVVARYAFNAPTLWAFEVGTMLTGGSFLLGIALTLRDDEHIRMDILSSRMGPKARAAVDLAGFLLLLLPLLSWLCWALLRATLAAWSSGERTGMSAWNPVLWPFRAVICTAFLLLLLQVLAETVKRVRRLAGRAGE